MTAGLDDWGALTTQAAVVVNGFLPWIALCAGMVLLAGLGFFFVGLFRGGDEGRSGGRSGRRGGSAAAVSLGSGIAERAGRSASRRVRASGVRREIRKAPTINGWAALEAHAKEHNGWNGKYGDEARVKP